MITKPIGVSQLNETLKQSHANSDIVYTQDIYDVGGLCIHQNINKFAKYKPIHHSGLQELTDDDRKDRISDGEFYGIICRQTNMNLGSLNNATFEYNRPKGGSSSPYRISDFVNYNHKAKPNVMGKLYWSTTHGEGYFDLDGDDNVYCDFYVHDPDNTEIDLSEIYTDHGILVSIRDMYPIFMFGTSETNMWVVAMRRIDTNQPAKIGDAVDANGIPRTSFSASFSSNFAPKSINDTISGDTSSSGVESVMTQMPSNFPTNTTEVEVPVTVSIGLVTSLAHIGMYDLNSWTQMSDKVLTNFALGVPADPSIMSYGLCGMSVKLKAKNANKYMSIECTYGPLSLSVSLSRSLKEATDNFVLPDSGNITINAYVSFDGDTGVSVVKSVPIKREDIETQHKYSASALFLWTEWGIKGGLSSGTVVKSRIRVYGIYDGVNIEIAKKSETITI